MNSKEIKDAWALEPGKIYCLQVKFDEVDWDSLEQLVTYLAKEGIQIVVISQDMHFVSIPEGYEVKKKEKINL